MATGDEWKGEESEGTGYFSFFGGKPLTAEQQAVQKRQYAEMKAKGDMLGTTLPSFDRLRTCPKCGNNKVKVQYCAGSEEYAGGHCYEHTGNHEHMHRSCKRCYYVWYEKPLGEVEA